MSLKTEDNNPILSPTILHRLYPWLIELWIASILLVFFIIRVLGSGMGQRVLSALGLRHLQ